LPPGVPAALPESIEEGDRRVRAGGQQPERFYLPQLDILRFFAFMAVFARHLAGAILQRRGIAAVQNSRAAGLGAGGYGVDLFLTLSSYLITELLLREHRTLGTLDVRRFYLRRILRIWPLYFFFLTVLLILSYSRGLFVEGWFPGHWFILYFVLLGNFVVCFVGPQPLLIAPLWSISVEEQFYLVWPLVVRNCSRRMLAWAALAMLAIATGARAAACLGGFTVLSIWENTLVRLDPIAVGVLVAALPAGAIGRFGRRAQLALIVAGVATWWLVATYCNPLYPTVPTARILLSYPAIAFGSGGFLVAALSASSTGYRSTLSRVLIYLGRISYGLYVYHGISIAFAEVVMTRLGLGPRGGLLPFSVMGAGLTLTLAAASYRWIETPFLRLKSRYTRVASRPI
jgi:peptidoglycan/LPS O-acetylase OafA/YrhL